MELNDFYGNCCYNRGFKISTRLRDIPVSISRRVPPVLHRFNEATNSEKEVVSQENEVMGNSSTKSFTEVYCKVFDSRS
ncbi:hypothetical protein JTE90_021644 [Oedothorax gibbosus]|uniref:Uncharacterized protein n=1 Tax=Oedothorax gibbosus TaxID=931172 RepID=A0AAV6VQB4_9ARAC|nr:hypothetical protein JTE90_021644 [Oedothorax gibbosus]